MNRTGKPESVHNRMSLGTFAEGTFADGTSIVVSMLGAPLPATATLNSADAARKIEVSTDGVTYHTVTPVYSVTGQLVAKIDFSVSHVRFDGVLADTYSVR